ncbi:hypothetical protein J8273_5577 [Carpediemonas membranifera]|uniref:Uncharacterized protein n=1 Tax=Carpediemonas membranifera TaxID=201153 RepID=A0A8J6ASJ3_9EUKA|nr:hypothetical protein J8273_5577 [Carpediemonas membranifera]|eukprot:KAG9392983.1 hypothetical protein J8273_5577 [Carpediemonas membranifera]
MELVETNDIAKELSTDRVASCATKVLQGAATMTEPPYGLCAPATPMYSASGRSTSSQISFAPYDPFQDQRQQFVSSAVPVARVYDVYKLLAAEPAQPPEPAERSQGIDEDEVDDTML